MAALQLPESGRPLDKPWECHYCYKKSTSKMLKKGLRKFSHLVADKLLALSDSLEDHHFDDLDAEDDLYAYEREFWGDCCNTFGEDIKHFTYAKYLGLKRLADYSLSCPAPKILDIGGGPSSILLKTVGLKAGTVVDPIAYPEWTVSRYKSKNIDYIQLPGEEFLSPGYDEAWIYNCLQHAIDPAKIISNALRSAKLLRIFEWIDIPAHEGHPHELTELVMNRWTGGRGRVVNLNERFCRGRAYYGVFRGN